ncbi:MAG: shikimate kinase [Sphingomonadales bacterium]|nr:shikimate kinase [Sphingomonadales bacterium]
MNETGERRRRAGAKLALGMAGLLPQRGALCIAPIMEQAARAYEKPIALIGLMGAGKSTIGRRLARRIGLPFVDADREIETAAGLTITEIFDRYGEAYFRDGERRVLARLVEGPPRVIATGGGAFMDEATRALILQRCIAIWLDAEVETLAERVGRRDHRPLLRGKDPRVLLQSLAEARGPIYAEAHLIVRGGAVPHEKMVDRIVAALAGR